MSKASHTPPMEEKTMTYEQWKTKFELAKNEKNQADRDWWWAWQNDRRNLEKASKALDNADNQISFLLGIRYKMIKNHMN